jgi:hypothetical protein
MIARSRLPGKVGGGVGTTHGRFGPLVEIFSIDFPAP